MPATALKTASAVLLATAIALPAVIAPAHAGGSVSFHLQPRNAQEGHAIRGGLAMYNIYNQVRSGASIRQIGRENIAGIAQNGRGNLGIVHQEGNGHNGTLTQNGNGNAYGLFQFGRNTSAHVTQNGGGSGATFQFGW